CSDARTASGYVVSVTSSRSVSKVWRKTSGPSDEPPMPSCTACGSEPRTPAAHSFSSTAWPRMAATTGSQPIRSAISAWSPGHSDGSRRRSRARKSDSSSSASAATTASPSSGCAAGTLVLHALLERRDQRVERGREALHAVGLELRRDRVQADAGRLHLIDDPAGAVDVLVDGAADGAVVEERGDRALGHRVHAVRPDQLLDVEDVGVGGV